VNPYSWSTDAHFIFIDQPIGTGLSTLPNSASNATYTTTIEQSTGQLLTAIEVLFFEHFPELRTSPLTITGESYVRAHPMRSHTDARAFDVRCAVK
jgi:carboxypeptidase C (cathepsin A)